MARLAQGAWPLVVGLLAGLAARRAIRPGPSGYAALALGAGVVALSFPIVRLMIMPFVGLVPEGSSASAAVAWVVGAQILAAFAMGVIARRLGRRHLMDSGMIGAAYTVVWLPQLTSWIRDRPSTWPRFVPQVDWQMFIPLLFALAALAGLTVGVFSQRLRPIAIDRRDRHRGTHVGDQARTK